MSRLIWAPRGFTGPKESSRGLTKVESDRAEDDLERLHERLSDLDAKGDPWPSAEQGIAVALRELRMSGARARYASRVAREDLVEDYGGDPHELALRSMQSGQDFGGEEAVFPDGYNQLTDRLAEGLDIHLDCVVSRIEHSDSGVRVVTNRGTFTADRAIVTFPLGVLQRGSIAFEPELPARKRQAIQRLGMGGE